MWSEQEEFGAFRAETDGLTGVVSQDRGHFDNFSGGAVIQFHLIGGCHGGIPVDGDNRSSRRDHLSCPCVSGSRVDGEWDLRSDHTDAMKMRVVSSDLREVRVSRTA